MEKQIGIVGLGKMGANIARILISKKWKVVGYNRSPEDTKALEKEGLIGAYSFDELVEKLPKPATILLVLPAGKVIDEVLFGSNGLVSKLSPNDILIDGANSFYKDAVRREKLLKKKKIKFIDAGISGGPGGALNGACLMVGGDEKLFKALEPLFRDMAKPDAYRHFKGVGAGHFVKMVHNGIEYGMMQSIAEGFTIMKKGPYELDFVKVCEIYNNGSVVEGRLVGWLHDAFVKFGQDLKSISGAVGFTGEGEWTAKTAKDVGVKAEIIEKSFKFRVDSQKTPSFTGKVLTGMRSQFGGHSTEPGKMT